MKTLHWRGGFLRDFVRSLNEEENQTFDAWMNCFETLLENYINVTEAEFTKNHKEHLKLLNRIINLRNEYEGIIDNFYCESYENFFIDVNKKYLRHAPLYVRKGGGIPLCPEIAKSLLTGIKISKKETNRYQKFKNYYVHGVKNCFSLKERALFFEDKITFDPDSYYDLNNLFPYSFPIVNEILPIGEWIEGLKKGFVAGVDKDELGLKEMVSKLQPNNHKIKYVNKISSHPFFSELARRSLLKKESISKS